MGLEGSPGHGGIDLDFCRGAAFEDRQVSSPPQEAEEQPRRAARAAGQEGRRLPRELHAEPSAFLERNAPKLLSGVKIKPLAHGEAGKERPGEQILFRGRADEDEGLEPELDRSRPRAGGNRQRQLPSVERLIKTLRHGDIQAVDLIDLPASRTSVTVPPEFFIQRDTLHKFEVLAIEAGGNQTIKEGEFVTAE